MKKVVKLKESDLTRIVKRVINESNQDIRYGKVINGKAVWDDEVNADDEDMDIDMDIDMDDEDMGIDMDMDDETEY